MPNFAINSTPSQISQTGTKAALIRNTGSSPVFLDAISAVSPDAYGVELQPLDSVTWEQGQTLWAVCAPGDASSLSVLYDASGVSLGAVSAVVTGDVTATIDGPVEANIQGTVPVDVQNAVINADVTGNIVVDSGEVNVGGILTPVAVQGGGEILLNTNGTIPAGGIQVFNIPAPVSGQTYFGLAVYFLGGAGPSMQLQIANNGSGAAASTNVQVLGAATTSGSLGSFGLTNRAAFTVPMAAPYPISGLIYNPDSVARNYTLQVNGIAQSQSYPIDAGEWSGGMNGRVAFSSAALNAAAYIAPSLQTRRFHFITTSASAGSVTLEALSADASPVWFETQPNPFNAFYGGKVGTNALQANAVAEIIVPGIGLPHRLRVTGAITGGCALAYVGRV